jgi:hypothetical protein
MNLYELTQEFATAMQAITVDPVWTRRPARSAALRL